MDPKDRELPTHGGPRKGAGRPKLPPEAKLISVTLRVLPAEREEYLRRGGAKWARKVLFSGGI